MKFVRESIFSSAFRSLCIAFFAVIGIALAFLVLTLLFGAGKTTRALELSNYDYVIPETNGRKYSFNNSAPLLLRLDIQGVIGTQKGITTEGIRSILNESTKGPLKSHPIKGILLYIDSPGGGANSSESIYFALKEYALEKQIPIYAYVEGLCASGGYLIACSADKILSSQSSWIGSVGTYAMFFNVSETLDKVGVKNKTLSRGIDKVAMNPFQPWTSSSDTSYLPLIDYGYERFVSIVTNARPQITPEQLVNTYGARVFTAPTAQNLGFIDSSDMLLSKATDQLAQAAGIDGNYQVISLVPKPRLSDLFNFDPLSQQSSFSLYELAKKTFLNSMNFPKESYLAPAEPALY